MRNIKIVINWIRVEIKSLFSEKNSIASIWKLIYTTIGYVSFVFSFAVLLNDLMSCDKVEIMCKNHWGVLLLLGVIASVVHNREKTSYKGTIKDDDLQIELKINDLFSVNASSYVIPTNTFFRTVMEREYISPRSVQGAFQLKYFREDIAALDYKIAESLAEQKIDGENAEDIHGMVKRYPIGTVAKVDYKDKHFYLVAINDVNQYGKPENQEYANVDVALKGLMDFIYKFGHYDNLVMPLIGTGKAAIRTATMERVFEDTLDEFVDSENKISRKLIICINPQDYLEERFDLKKLKRYVDYKCEFKK